jgi:hypothetical protein
MAIIRGDERIFIAGKTGSGKTELAKHLLYSQEQQFFILDNKGMFGRDKDSKKFIMKEAAPADTLEQCYSLGQKYRFVVYRPAPELESNRQEFLDTMNSFLWWIYYRQNTGIYIDEATAISDSYNILPAHNAIMKRGRELNVPCWNSSQQPVNVHNTLMSEADHFFVFITQMQSHRDKLAGFMGDNVKKTVPRNYTFFYFNPATMDEAELMNPIKLF